MSVSINENELAGLLLTECFNPNREACVNMKLQTNVCLAALLAAMALSNYAAAAPMRDIEKAAIASFLQSLEIKPGSTQLNVLQSRTNCSETFARTSKSRSSTWMPKATRQVMNDFARVAEDCAALDDSPALVLPTTAWQIVDSATLDHMFATEGGQWKEFHSTYPGADNLISVSRAGIDEKSQQALFAISISSGPMDGIAFYVLLGRNNGKWRVLTTQLAWIT
ncbi:MAG: hypothetical protein ACJ8GW_14235 [Massilia sp.]